MELALQKFIHSVSKIIDNENLDNSNPFVLKLTDGQVAHTEKFTVVAANTEPATIGLPIFCTWIDLDSRSKYFNEALQLVGFNGNIDLNADIDPSSIIFDDGLTHSWIRVSSYSQIFRRSNIYYLDGAVGPTGLQGPVGIPGIEGVIDYPTIVDQAIAQVSLVLH